MHKIVKIESYQDWVDFVKLYEFKYTWRSGTQMSLSDYDYVKYAPYIFMNSHKANIITRGGMTFGERATNFRNLIILKRLGKLDI